MVSNVSVFSLLWWLEGSESLGCVCVCCVVALCELAFENASRMDDINSQKNTTAFGASSMIVTASSFPAVSGCCWFLSSGLLYKVERVASRVKIHAT